MPPKISIDQYTFLLNNNIPYTGYVIGLGYADLASGCILPETFGLFNPPGRTKSYNDSFCQSFFVPTVDTSPYMYAKSLDISVEEITRIVTKANAGNILVYLGNGKSVSVPKNDSGIDVKLVDDGANIYIEIKADSPSSLFAPKFGRITLLDFLGEYRNGSVNAAMNQKTSREVGVAQSTGGEVSSGQGGYSGDDTLFTVADWTNNGIDGLATGMERSGGTFRLSNSNGFSLKHYPSGWRGNGSVTTYNTATWGSRIAKGSLVINLGLGAYSINNANIADGRTFGYNTQVATAQVAGGMAGSWAGASIGASIGVWFGGIGAVPGAVIGGVIGGVLGGWGGSELGGTAVDWYY
jgi:hypothetical protein